MLFPEDLFTRIQPSTAVSSTWMVLYTRARAEKVLARGLYRHQHSFFLPLYERGVKVAGRIRRAYLPIFPGYLFLNGGAQERLAALETNCVSRCIAVYAQDELQRDLARVFHLITTGLPLVPEPRLEPGTLVEVTSGIMEGLQGKILRRGGQLRLVIEVHLLHQAVSVEIDEHLVRRVDDRHTSARALVSAE
jgi:transcription termination/antitermination protein NusG